MISDIVSVAHAESNYIEEKCKHDITEQDDIWNTDLIVIKFTHNVILAT